MSLDDDCLLISLVFFSLSLSLFHDATVHALSRARDERTNGRTDGRMDGWPFHVPAARSLQYVSNRCFCALLFILTDKDYRISCILFSFLNILVEFF